MPSIRQDIEIAATIAGVELRLASTWGLFSPKAVDEGSRLLAESVDLAGEERILDVGCGYGVIGLALAKRAPASVVELVDKDFVAVEYAKKNAERNACPNARAYLSNGLAGVERHDLDLVVSNLPAKVGNELLTIIIEDAHAHLAPGGRLMVVTIAGLKEVMKRLFGASFGNYTKVAHQRSWGVFMAEKKKS